MGGQRRRNIYQVAEEFRARLAQLEREALAEYGQRVTGVLYDAEALLRRLATLTAEGDEARWLAFDVRRMTELRDQLAALVQRGMDEASTVGQGMLQRAAEQAADDALQLVLAAPGSETAEIMALWSHLSREAIEQQVGVLQPGSPLYDLLQAAGKQAQRDMEAALLRGVSLGINPRQLADMWHETVTISRQRAERILRTEMMRTYREVTRQAYQANSRVVSGWIWYSALDVRTCPACWAMHGTYHTLDEQLDDHPNGRCTMVPVTRTWQALGLEAEETGAAVLTGEALFARLPVDRQQEILGSERAWLAYRAGTVRLSDFVGRRFDPRWGSMRYARSVASMLGGR